MADSVDVTLTLGHVYRSSHEDLFAYLEQEMPIECAANQRGDEASGQRLTLVCGDETHPNGLAGSGQAGSIRIYAGLIRRGSGEGIARWLENAPWKGVEAVLVVHGYGPPVVTQLYPDRHPMWWI